jgi:hypothetical protein
LELPDKLQDQASEAQQEIRKALSKQLAITDSFLSGSYPRHTKIDPLKDIDVILVRNTLACGLSTDGSGTYPATAVQEIATAARRAYPGAAITQQPRSVNLQLSGLRFGFDLVPAWRRVPDGYWIPDADLGQWLPTNPDFHAGQMTDCNKARNGKLKPLVKMAKHWSRHNLDLLRSFHIELICLDLAAKYELGPYQQSMAGFLADLGSYLGKTWMDPAYGVCRVDKPLSPPDLEKLGIRVKSDADRACIALGQERQGNHIQAISTWAQVFLTGFPS